MTLPLCGHVSWLQNQADKCPVVAEGWAFLQSGDLAGCHFLQWFVYGDLGVTRNVARLDLGRCGSNFKVWFSNPLCIVVISTLDVKLHSGECHRTSLMGWMIVSGNDLQRSRLRRPISKICMILLMDAKIWMVSLIIVFVVHPICTQDAIFKMSSMSPGLVSSDIKSLLKPI